VQSVPAKARKKYVHHASAPSISVVSQHKADVWLIAKETGDYCLPRAWEGFCCCTLFIVVEEVPYVNNQQ